jgi:hypothetical protein
MILFTVRSFIVEGASALLQHNPMNLMRAPDEKPNTKKILSADQEAELSTYRLNGKGSQLYGPAQGFKAGIVSAGRGRRLGKLGAPGVLLRSVSVVPGKEKCLLFNQKTHKPITTYTVDVRRAVLPSSGAGILRARAEVHDWMTEVDLQIDEEQISPDLVVEFFELAGRSVGWMDHRPECGGYHGTYTVKMKK